MQRSVGLSANGECEGKSEGEREGTCPGGHTDEAQIDNVQRVRVMGRVNTRIRVRARGKGSVDDSDGECSGR